MRSALDLREFAQLERRRLVRNHLMRRKARIRCVGGCFWDRFYQKIAVSLVSSSTLPRPLWRFPPMWGKGTR
jgi:hypothetical protein